MVYLDNSASSFFKPKEVFDAFTEALSCPANPSRASHKGAVKAGMTIYNARKEFAQAFNTNADFVIFTSGCTEALNMAIFGLALNCHVIATVFEHNSVLRPLYELRRRGKIQLSIVSSPLEAKRALQKNTKLLVVNHVCNVNGAVADIESYAEIAKKHKLIFLVDGAQSGGYFDVDMDKLGIDMLAVAGHKGLHGVQGAGALILSSGFCADFKPTKFGGTGTFSSNPMQPNSMPEGFESGTPPTPAIACMSAGLKWSIKHQKENAERLFSLSAGLIERLNRLGVRVFSYPNECGIVAFCLDRIGSAVACNEYDKADIALRCGFHCAPLVHKYFNTTQGLIRASFGVESTFWDIDVLIDATKAILKSAL